MLGTVGSTATVRVPILESVLGFKDGIQTTVCIGVRSIPPFANNAKDPGFPTARSQPWPRVRLSNKKQTPGLSGDLDGESAFLWTYTLNFVDTPAHNTVLDALPHSQASQFLNFSA